MKKIFLFSIVVIAISISFANFSNQKENSLELSDSLKTVSPEKFHPNVERLVSTIFNRYHYKKVDLNDSLSSVIFDRYLKALDYHRSYFVKSDIESFEKYRYEFDEYLMNGELEPTYEIFNIFNKRVNERLIFVDSLLQTEFDFSKDEYFQVNRENAEWPADAKEANEIWRKRVKHDALNLKLTGKEWDSVVETLEKRYDNFQRNVLQYNSEDVFQLLMNSYSEAIDPHTNYLSPITSENFKINMSLSLEGIGAQLQSEDDYTKVAEIIPGGPAFKSDKLHRNDRIIGVAQDDEEMVDVVGWRLTDVVQLIRGPKGTKVRLQILKAEDGVNAVPKEITLTRDKVKLEEQSAKKDVIELMNNNVPYKVGVITIPAFYNDFEAMQKGEKDYKSTTRDVKNLLTELKKENVDGVIIDLRNNGGGSLTEAIDMTGLFIKDGPVVQVRNSDGTVDVGDDPDPSIVYSGPLAVVVNRFSASASEIFAGAIQDYGRGIVLGEQTYGKGTVQNLIDLNRLMSSTEKMGQVKLTIAKYYRINGGSTQHRGVIPDIQFPSAIDPMEFGESSEPSALPWDQINSTKYNKYSDLSDVIPKLEDAHKSRVTRDKVFDDLLSEIEEYREQKEQKMISLNEKVRKKEKEEAEEKKMKRENKKETKLVDKEETTTSIKNIDDPVLKESANILADLILYTVG